MIENKHVRVCDDEQCIVCRDWRDEKRRQAIPWLLARTQKTTGAQSELGRFKA